MSEKNNRNNDIESALVVETINEAVQNCYGVYGLSDRLGERKGLVSQGVVLQRHPDRRLSVEIYLVVSPNMKITEVLREAQNQLYFVLNKKYPRTFRTVDVYADYLA